MEKKIIDQLLDDTDRIVASRNLEQKYQQYQTLEAATQQAGFWERGDAQVQIQALAQLQKEIKKAEHLQQLSNDLRAALELDLEEEIESLATQLQRDYKEAEIEQYLSGKYDSAGALLSIHPGQGGTEAMDWADMLKRMYQRYFERKGWKYQLLNEIRGEEAGLKEVSFAIQGDYAYGYLKGEHGTHRLVRQSPFNADNLRQTSFALVEVLPLVERDNDIEIKESDLAWNFTRAGGAGGQYVNKVSSAVELTHLPTGIVVKCREERSQIQNRERALQILKAKLAKIEEEKYEAEMAQSKGQYHNASWGTQIRNYVLHPYQLVKDTRTEVETNQTAEVLDGDLDQFILPYVKRPRS